MESIILQLVERYLPLAEEGTLERQMLMTMKDRISDFTDDKANRWLGFIQGILYSKNLISVLEEREFTRPLFHKYYEENNIDKPPSIDAK